MYSIPPLLKYNPHLLHSTMQFDGIDNCCVVIVFATRNYIDKVGGKNGDGDNCLKEFNYADMRKTTKNMHVVVNEAGCRNPTTWDGTMVRWNLFVIHLQNKNEKHEQSNLALHVL